MHYAQFRHLAIEDAKQPPTFKQVAAIETLLGARLPSSFIDYLQVANGGYLEYVVDIPTGEGTSEQLSFCGLFSADDGKFCDETFVGELRAAREHASVPEGVLPFARDGGGSVVYLDLSPEGKGRVIAFVLGLPEWTGLRTESGYVELASSFDEYVNMLRIDRGAALDHLQRDATNQGQIDATEEWFDIGLPGWRATEPELVAAVSEARRRLAPTET